MAAAGGNRRIPLKRRDTKEQRAVSFSKRRHGLLNKAAEYCLRTRSQLALLVSSPVSDTTFYTFGHSSVDAVLDAFVNNRAPEAANKELVRLGILMFNEIKDLELYDKKISKAIKSDDYFGREGFWEDYEKLGNSDESIGELRVIVDKLVKAKEKAILRMNDLLISPQVSNSSSCGASASTSNGGYACDEHFKFVNNYACDEQFKFGNNYACEEQFKFGNNYACEEQFKFGNNHIHGDDNDKEFIKLGTGYVGKELRTDLELEEYCDANQSYFGNFLTMGADTNIAHQNCLAYQPDPIAIANGFGQRLPYDVNFLNI